MVLITYVCERDKTTGYKLGYTFDESVENFLTDVQDIEDEAYYVVNSHKVSDSFFEQYDGDLKGL